MSARSASAPGEDVGGAAVPQGLAAERRPAAAEKAKSGVDARKGWRAGMQRACFAAGL
jgi:hypothetical protein